MVACWNGRPKEQFADLAAANGLTNLEGAQFERRSFQNLPVIRDLFIGLDVEDADRLNIALTRLSINPGSATLPGDTLEPLVEARVVATGRW